MYGMDLSTARAYIATVHHIVQLKLYSEDKYHLLIANNIYISDYYTAEILTVYKLYFILIVDKSLKPSPAQNIHLPRQSQSPIVVHITTSMTITAINNVHRTKLWIDLPNFLSYPAYNPYQLIMIPMMPPALFSS